MVPLIVAAVVIAFLLVVLKVIWWPLALVALLVVIGFAAWRFDRSRSVGAAAPYLDRDRPDFHGSSSATSWEVPTPYIDHRTGAGEPPGVARGDETAPRR